MRYASSDNKSFNPKDYWENRLKQNYGLEGVGYIGLGEQYNGWMYKIRRRVFYRAIDHVKKDFGTADVLDIGSGTGFYVARWKELGVRTIAGSDLTDIVIRKLKNEYPSDAFYQLDIGDDNAVLSIKHQQQFDIISAFDVLYHITDDNHYKRSIKNIYNLLRPGGYLVMSDNFLHADAERRNDQVSRSLEQINEIVKCCGFSIVVRLPMFVTMNYPIDSNSRLRKLLWKLLMLPVTQSELVGYILGACLYPLELALTLLLKESASTEVMVCKKSGINERDGT